MPLTALELDILRILRRSAEPLSGRQVADIAGVAPNTANKTLKVLQRRALVGAGKKGRATLWTTTADVVEVAELAESTHERTVLVVTAVELEHTEVHNRLVNAERVRVGGTWMVRGEVPGHHIDWTVYLARAGMGNATSAALVGLAARELRANLVAFVGTAAGLKPSDQRHLDVIVASRIHNPYAGKQVPTEVGSVLLGRDRTYAVPAPMVAAVNAYIADSEWASSPRSRNFNAKHPHAFVAPIVSVEAVQADPDGPLLQQIRNRFQDAAALDMESFGLAAGSDIHDLPVLVVRGISDFIGDKTELGNDDQQPLAAGNAAWLLRDLLLYGHPDDFQRGMHSPVPTVPLSDQSDTPQPALPGAVQFWMNRLENRSAVRANLAQGALAEMRISGIATWVSRALHRPPAWLREDDTGDGWALVAWLASLSGSKVVWRTFEKAAAAARLTGDLDASAYFTLVARLERIGTEQDGDNAEEPAPSDLDDFPDHVVARLGFIVDFYRAVLEKDLAKVKVRAEVALAALGLTDKSGVLRPPVEPIRVVDFDPALRDLVAATLLRQLATMMLAPGAADKLGVETGLAARTLRGNPVTRDLADDAFRIAQWAVALCPYAEGTRLTLAQATLAVLVSMTGRPAAAVDDEISRRAMEVEAEAMLVRDALRDWGGSSGSALAVASRARTIQGDFNGALRMLLPAPDGIASQREAVHPDVIRMCAHIAQLTGNDELALELAAKNPDRLEGELMRAAVLETRPQMANEAKTALLAALELSEVNHHDFRALNALSRRYNSLDESEQATVTAHITRLEKLDPELAAVISVRVLISQGDPEAALRCVRSLERNELVLTAHADALVASKRADEAALLVFNEGISRGDIPLATEAIDLAMNHGLQQIAREMALELLGRDDCKPVRLKVLRALQRTARSDLNWQEVATRTEQVIKELREFQLPVPEAEHWRLAQALFFQEKFEKGITVLLEAPAISFGDRDNAQLFLAMIWRAVDQQRGLADAGGGGTTSAGLKDPKLYAMFMRAAADWAHDEQIAAAAMSVMLTAPDTSFSDAQIADIRDYAENYFTRHGEDASIARVDVGDGFEPLIEFLRAGESRQDALEELSREVRAGHFPLAVLTEAAGRTTTESLIRRDLGYIIAVGEDSGISEQTARKALGGRVVVDITAVVVAPWTGETFRRLAANFDSVLIPAPLREDVSRARSSLALKSSATLSWDSRAQRPVVTETTTEEAQVYAQAVEQVWADIQRLQVVPVDEATLSNRWLSAITVAQELGVPIWADDVAVRRFARVVGADAFGTIDLIRALDSDSGVIAAISSFRNNRVVDVPIDRDWYSLADEAGWSTGSPFGIAISRPAAWRNIPEAFENFRTLLRLRPNDLGAETLAAWAHLGANGLAMATTPLARPKVVSALLAWVIFNTDSFFSAVREGAAAVNDATVPQDGGRVTEHILAAADALRDQYYPLADALALIVDILCRGLLASIGPQATSRIVAALVKRLNRDTGSRVFAAYIQSAGK